MPNVGSVTRWQANAALQWQVTPSLQAYVDGLYTYFRTTSGFTGFNPSPYTKGTTISNVVATDDCYDAPLTAAGTNPQIIHNAHGTQSLQTLTVQTQSGRASGRAGDGQYGKRYEVRGALKKNNTTT